MDKKVNVFSLSLSLYSKCALIYEFNNLILILTMVIKHK